MQGQIVSHGVLEFKKCRVMNVVQLGSTLNSCIEIIKPYFQDDPSTNLLYMLY